MESETLFHISKGGKKTITYFIFISESKETYPFLDAKKMTNASRYGCSNSVKAFLIGEVAAIFPEKVSWTRQSSKANKFYARFGIRKTFLRVRRKSDLRTFYHVFYVRDRVLCVRASGCALKSEISCEINKFTKN